ncbi:MAG: DUF2312 domain-containing protein [Parvularculaceae bacterium]
MKSSPRRRRGLADVKTLRKIVRLVKMDRAKRDEEEALLDLYLSALGE